MFRFTPTTETVPPVAAQETASTTVASAPTASMTDSAPRPPRGLHHLLVARRLPGIDRLGSQLLGPGQPLGHHVDGQDARRAEQSGALHGHDADGTEPDDDDGGPRSDDGTQRAHVAGGQDVGQQHRVFVGHALGDGQGEEVGERHGHGLGLTAGEVGDGAERGGLAGLADVGLPGQAGPADTAADDARDEHPVARPVRAHVRADLGHRADGLVTEPDARPGRRVVVQVQIRAADGGALDRDDDARRSGQHRVGHVLDADVARTLEDGRSHARTLSRPDYTGSGQISAHALLRQPEP